MCGERPDFLSGDVAVIMVKTRHIFAARQNPTAHISGNFFTERSEVSVDQRELLRVHGHHCL